MGESIDAQSEALKPECVVGSEALKPECVVGVVFIHGIGEPAKGDHLNENAEELISWLKTTLAEPSKRHKHEQPVVMLETVTHQPLITQPAHTQIRICTNGVKQTWLMAEAHWAQSFRVPSFLTLFQWLISVGPALLLYRATQLLTNKIKTMIGGGDDWVGDRKHQKRLVVLRIMCAFAIVGPAILSRILMEADWLRSAALAAAVVMAIPAFINVMIVAVILLVCIAAALSLLPFVSFASFFRRLSGTLVNYLGDGYVVISASMARDAIDTRIRESVDFVRQRLGPDGKLAIIAHSQGAYLIREMLTANEIKEPDVLVTYGSAWELLTRLQHLTLNIGKTCSFVCSLVALIVGLAPFAICLFYIYRTSLFQHNVFCAMALVVVAILAWILPLGIRVQFDHWFRDIDKNKEELRNNPMKNHHDIYAPLDPATEGAVSAPWPEPWPKGRDYGMKRVRNSDSPTTDHTSFWKNKDHFVGYIATLLLKLGGTPINQLKLWDGQKVLDQPKDALAYLRRRWKKQSLRIEVLYTGLILHSLAGLVAAWCLPDLALQLTRLVVNERVLGTVWDLTVQRVLNWSPFSLEFDHLQARALGVVAVTLAYSGVARTLMQFMSYGWSVQHLIKARGAAQDDVGWRDPWCIAACVTTFILGAAPLIVVALAWPSEDPYANTMRWFSCLSAFMLGAGCIALAALVDKDWDVPRQYF